MRSRRLSCAFAFVAAAAIFSVSACGGDDDGGGGGTPDAKVFLDAPPQMDAPAGVTGLGQRCGASLPACPSTAPVCLTAGSGDGFCSLLCHMDAQLMTNAQGQISGGTDLTADNAKCTAIFTASPGAAICEVPVDVQPPPQNPLQANTTFTYQAHCAVQCGAGNACPSGMTCNTQVMWCLPS